VLFRGPAAGMDGAPSLKLEFLLKDQGHLSFSLTLLIVFSQN
jgi:hypothetical protein